MSYEIIEGETQALIHLQKYDFFLAMLKQMNKLDFRFPN